MHLIEGVDDIIRGIISQIPLSYHIHILFAISS